jgi:hypothetical protein
LRTGFVWEGLDEPLQIVYRSVEIQPEWHDLSFLSKLEQESHINNYLVADLRRERNLRKPPLMNVALFKLSADSHRLIWSSHHLLMDGWSMPLLVKALICCYEAGCQGEESRQGQARPYKDYIAWLQTRDKFQAHNFWAEELKGFTLPTPFFPEKEVIPFSDHSLYDERKFRVTIERASKIRAMARKSGLTLNTLLLGAWAILLSCYSENEDVVFGVVVSGRPPALRGVESIIGLFINILPVRARLERDRLSLEWLRNLQSRLVEMREYEYYPLTDILRLSEVPGHLPLFDTILVFENYPVDRSMSRKFAGLEIIDLHTVSVSHYPLSVTVSAGDEFAFRFTFRRRRFEPAVVERIAKQLEVALFSLSTHPDWKLGKVIETLAQSDQQLQSIDEEAIDNARLEKLYKTRRRVTRVLPKA